MISMLTGSTSLASKCVFYRHEQSAKAGVLKLKFEALKMQRWSKTTDRAQRVDEKMASFL